MWGSSASVGYGRDGSEKAIERPPYRRYNHWIVLQRLPDRQHAIQRDARPLLLLVGHDDPVVHLARHEPFEHPQQMIRRHPEHRRAQAAELIEREDGAVGRDLLREAVDEMDFSAD